MSEYKKLLVKIEDLEEEVKHLDLANHYLRQDNEDYYKWYISEQAKVIKLTEEIARLSILVRELEMKQTQED